VTHALCVDDHLLSNEPRRKVEGKDHVGQEGDDENVTPVLFIRGKGTQQGVGMLGDLVNDCIRLSAYILLRAQVNGVRKYSHGEDDGASIATTLHAWLDDTSRTRSPGQQNR
jgi:hypothetical protein